MDTAPLIDLGFVFVGAWASQKSRPNKNPAICLKPGVYAFVVGDSVMYVSHAAFLDRRLRTHTRKAFWGEKAGTDEVNSKIAASINHGHEVLVFAKLFPVADVAPLEHLEAKLIELFKPPWNQPWKHNAVDAA